MTPPLSERLTAARAEVDRAGHLLLAPTPEQLDQSTRVLAAAVAAITACRDAARRSPTSIPSVAEEARRLQRSILHARRLLDAAAAFHADWVQFLGALCAGYTDRGEAAAIERGSRLCARG